MTLNLWKFKFAPWKYPSNWGRNITYVFRIIKWSWQRTTKGFCDYDAWDLDYYYSMLIRDSLRHLAENSHGYPDSFENHEAWAKWLKETADCFEKAIDHEYCDEDETPIAYKNKYSDEYYEMIISDKRGSKEFEELSDKYRKEAIRIYNQRQSDLVEGLDRLKKYWNNLWD